MKNYFIIGMIALVGCKGEPKQTETEKIQYPETKRIDHTDTYFGVDIKDDFQWLEDDRSKETAQWVKAQNELTFSYLDKIPFRKQIKKRLEKLWNYPKVSSPFKRGDWYYFYKNDGLQNQYVLYRKKSLDGEEEVFLDPNTLKEDGTAALGSNSFSKDGKYFAYAINEAGSDWQTIYVKNTETKENLDEVLEWCKFTGMAWAGDGFYYSRYEKPEGSEFSKSNEAQRVFYHQLNTPQSEDVLIYERPDFPKRYLFVSTTEDENFLVVGESEGTSGTMAYLKDLRNSKSTFVSLNKNFDNDHYLIDNIGNSLYFLTNLDAANYKLVKVDAANPSQDNWTDVIPSHEKNVLQSVNFTGGKMFVKYMQDAYHKIYQYSIEGELEKEIEMPSIGSVSGFGGKMEDTETFYTFNSFTYPSVIYKYDITSGTSALYNQPEVSFNPDDYETKQIFYPSKDGTKVPMFIVYKKGIDINGAVPTYLYSYGGFNISLNPKFDVKLMPWLENGGIYAMPNIRGGGEYGEEWHKGGMLLKKQNVFDDFIAAAEYLIEEGYTSSEKLCISGRSNGGLLVGACMTQRPDLYAVALPGVGVMDMLKYHKFTVGWGWVVEYGSSDDSLHFNNLIKFSPLHNIDTADYPATLVYTADHDDRVVPAHSFKFISELQSQQKGNKPVMIRIDVDAGHGSGKPTQKQIEEWSDIWSFVLYNMGEEFETK